MKEEEKQKSFLHKRKSTKIKTIKYFKSKAFRYIIDIIDHFTKFSQSYLLNTKETLEVFCKIRE